MPSPDSATPSGPEISTCLWFDDQAEAAVRLYCSLFEGAEITEIFYKNGDPQAGAFTVAFTLLGQKYWGLNGGAYYKLTPAVSISVYVDTQAEVDRLWHALLEGGAESRCGWLTDRYGVSWQIVPQALLDMLSKKDDAAAQRAMAAMLGMKKLDIAALQRAYRNEGESP